jgi:hypothetical protein
MKPIKCSDLDVAFPASVADVMPAYDAIPVEFKRGSNPWAQLTSEWFYGGLNGDFVTKEGIDKSDALRHLKRIMGSFEPKHEHKFAAVAYLMSEWFVEFKRSPEKKAARK